MTTSNHLIHTLNCENTRIDWNEVVKNVGDTAILTAFNLSEMEQLEPIDNYEKLGEKLSEIESTERLPHEKILLLLTISKYSNASDQGCPIFFFDNPQGKEITHVEFIPGEEEVLYKVHQYDWNSSTALFLLNDQKLPVEEGGTYSEETQNREKEAKLTFLKSSCQATSTNWSNIESLSSLDHSLAARMRGMMDKIREVTKIS